MSIGILQKIFDNDLENIENYDFNKIEKVKYFSDAITCEEFSEKLKNAIILNDKDNYYKIKDAEVRKIENIFYNSKNYEKDLVKALESKRLQESNDACFS